MPSLIEAIATAIFAIALVHTFSTKFFEHLAHTRVRHAGLYRLLGEVEVVFGFWAMVLLAIMAVLLGTDATVSYLEGRNFTEPAFVFVIMVVAASRPITMAAEQMVTFIARVLPMNRAVAFYFTVLTFGPLLGSFITEPAAMTLSALILRDRFYAAPLSSKLKYATVGALFVNVSIGGTLTPYAAPPVLMVASTWGFDLWFMITTFGWRAAIAVFINAAVLAVLFRREIVAAAKVLDEPSRRDDDTRPPAPIGVTLAHLLFLAGIVVFAHHPIIFVALFLMFLGFTEAYKRYQNPLILREGLLVGFFLAGLVTLGAQQRWWLEVALTGLDDNLLYLGATALTAITDNAALTYLGSLVPGVSDGFKYALVAGAVSGGGLTVIANAPNPAGFSILKPKFDDETIGAGGLLVAALPPTIVSMLLFKGDALLDLFR